MILLLIVLLSLIIYALQTTLLGVKAGRLAGKAALVAGRAGNKVVSTTGRTIKKKLPIVAKQKGALRRNTEKVLKTGFRAGKKVVGTGVKVAVKGYEYSVKMIVVVLKAVRGLLISLWGIVCLLDIVIFLILLLASAYYIMYLSDGTYKPTSSPQTQEASSKDSEEDKISRDEVIKEICEYMESCDNYVIEMAKDEATSFYYNCKGNGKKWKDCALPGKDVFEDYKEIEGYKGCDCSYVARWTLSHILGDSGSIYNEDDKWKGTWISDSSKKDRFDEIFETIELSNSGKAEDLAKSGELEPGDIIGIPGSEAHTYFYGGKNGDNINTWYDSGHKNCEHGEGYGDRLKCLGYDEGNPYEAARVIRVKKDGTFYKWKDGTIHLTSENKDSDGDSGGEIDTSKIKESPNYGVNFKSLVEEVIANWDKDGYTKKMTSKRKKVVQSAINAIGVCNQYSQNDGSHKSGGRVCPYNEIPECTDCSGFVTWCYSTLDKSSQAAWGGYTGGMKDGGKYKKSSFDDIVPGDVGFKNDLGGTAGNSDHTGIYLGKDNGGNRIWIHCTSAGGSSYPKPGGVKVNNYEFPTVWRCSAW